MQKQARNRGLRLGFDGCRRCPARQRLLPLATVQRGANLPGEPCRPGQRKVDLQGDGQPGVFPDGLGSGRIALGHGLIHHHHIELVAAQRGKRAPAPLRHIDFRAELRPDRAAQFRAPSSPLTIRMPMLNSFLLCPPPRPACFQLGRLKR